MFDHVLLIFLRKKGKTIYRDVGKHFDRTRTVYGMRVNREIPKVAKKSLLWHTFYPNILESWTLSMGMDSLRFTAFVKVKKKTIRIAGSVRDEREKSMK